MSFYFWFICIRFSKSHEMPHWTCCFRGNSSMNDGHELCVSVVRRSTVRATRSLEQLHQPAGHHGALSLDCTVHRRPTNSQNPPALSPQELLLPYIFNTGTLFLHFFLKMSSLTGFFRTACRLFVLSWGPEERIRAQRDRGTRHTEQPLSNKLLFNRSYLCAISGDRISIPVHNQNTHIWTSVPKAEKPPHSPQDGEGKKNAEGFVFFLDGEILTGNDGAFLLNLSHVTGKHAKPYSNKPHLYYYSTHSAWYNITQHTHSEMDTLQQRT